MPERDVASEIIKAIDKAVEASAEDPRRRHLGASVLGRRCAREVYYGWRWFYSFKHTGRILRLFERGQLEEDRFIGFLEAVGLEVRATSQRLVYHSGSDSFSLIDWEQDFNDDLDDVSGIRWAEAMATKRGIKPKQWRVSAHNGHLGGSMDGKLLPPDQWRAILPPGWGLGEYKTHGSKSFATLKSKGLQTAKLEHYVQMQTYMHLEGLEWGLYLAVNKDTDELHAEIVFHREEIAEAYIDRAGKVIYATEPPARITNDPSWFECKFCDYREVCHHGKAPEKNCRTCVYSRPSDEIEHPGEWRCAFFNGAFIPDKFMRQGCDNWDPIQ